MKLATLKNGTRDGQLVVVSRDLRYATVTPNVAPTMLRAIEDWSRVKGALIALYQELNAGRVENAMAFDPSKCAAPLPRAPQWLDASSFLNHGELMQKAFGLDPIDNVDTIPLMYQGASDDFLGPTDDIVAPAEFDDVPMGTTARDAASHIKLLVLINDVSLRAHAPREMRTGFGFLHAKPSTAFAAIAVTPDELGEAWLDSRVQLPLRVEHNGVRFGEPHGREMNFSFGELIAHATRTRRLRAGTIVGSGTYSNASRDAGSACIAERRAIELIDLGAPKTGFMRFGDSVRLEMKGADGASVFGAIEQRVVAAFGTPVVNEKVR
jgi:fumarylacetoacetate (FAA) hydrolase